MIDIKIGDSREVLKTLPSDSVQCCITSPPYYGLRDYGVKKQIGLEKTPEEYVQELVSVFEEVKRVLRPDGTLWLNLGDSYSGSGGNIYSGFNHRFNSSWKITGKQSETANHFKKVNCVSLPAKNLIGIPWRVAFALQAAGWYLRQDIIYSKTNPIPESVKDRCTRSHEYIFLLSKSAKYFFDNNSIKEPAKYPNDNRGSRKDTRRGTGYNSMSGQTGVYKNKRDVWTITSKPYKGAHFATFPPTLVEPCILAGCPPGGLVLDPFAGSGTVGEVCNKLNRNAVLIELNQEYEALIKKRCNLL